jgi:hypothetical protein
LGGAFRFGGVFFFFAEGFLVRVFVAFLADTFFDARFAGS